MMNFIRSLDLEEKLSPRKNADIIWFYVFFPAVVAYFVILTSFINSKPFIGRIEVIDPSFTGLIYPDKNIEVIATGLQWAEGPIWIADEAAGLSYLMFSDTIANRIYKWEDGKGMFTVGKTIYVENSGCKTNPEYCTTMYESGSNGLLRRDSSSSSTSLDLLVCQHGERGVGLLRDNGSRTLVATHYNGSRLNSPNDLILSPEGHLYFTDPPYGLLHSATQKVKGKELRENGVYMVRSEYLQIAMETGEPTEHVWLMEGGLERPNGLAFSPDFSKLYVANSFKKSPAIHVFDVTDNGLLKNRKLFFDVAPLLEEKCRPSEITGEGEEGAASLPLCDTLRPPDGLKVDIHGNIFAAGPNGVVVLSPEGKLIGRFRMDKKVSNMAFGADGRLYFTAEDVIARVWIKTKPNRVIKK
jgi:gluconolactonase